MEFNYSSLKKLLQTEIEFGINKKQLSLFLRQFSALLDAGLGVDESIFYLTAQKELKSIRSPLERVHRKVLSGKSLYESFSQEKRFDPLFVSMMRGGEETGKLSSVTKQLSVYYEREYELKQKMTQAMSYPIILFITLIVVLFFLFQNVLPTFVDLFEESGSILPLSTRILLAVSGFFSNYQLFILFFSLGFIIMILLLYQKQQTRYILDRFIFNIPIISIYLIQIHTGYMVRSLSILSKNSIPFLSSLQIVSEGSKNSYYKNKILEAREKIAEGIGIGEAFKGDKIFPDLLVSMLSVGEKTGDIGEMLNTTANFYDKETDYAIKSLMGFLEPFMIIIMAIIVGAIVISIATPMFDLINNYSI